MKKLLSMILACAMVMSLFCAIPAGAASTSVEHSFPYIIETFEDGDVSFFGDTELLVKGEKDSVVTAAGEGYGASENAAKITYIGTQHIGNYLYNSNGEKITLSAKKGDVFTATFWMKSDQNLAATNLLLVLWSDTYWKNNAQTTFDGANRGWQKITMSYTFPADYEVDRIELRFGNTGGANLVAGDTGGAVDRVYLVDNFEMKIGKVYSTEKVYDFTTYDGNVFKAGGLIKGQSVQPDPKNSSNKAYKFEFKDRTLVSENTDAKAHIHGSNYGTFNWYENRPVKTGDSITVSFDVYVASTYFSSSSMKVGTQFYPRNASGSSDFTTSNKIETGKIDMTKVGQWQTVTIDLGTATADSNFYNYYLFIRQDDYAPVGNELYQEGTASKNGKAFQTYMLSETVMYLDNLKVNIVPSAGDTVTPVVTGASAIMDAYTGIVTPDYTFATPGGTTPVDASYYKLLDGDKVIASFAKGTDIVVPDAYKASENLKLTIVPYSEGYFGEEVTTAINPEFEIDLESSDITFTANSVEVEVGFKHLNSGGTTANVLFIVCAYDANGALIDYGVASIVCAPGATVDADHVADGIQNPKATVTAANIASAKAFVWGCGDQTPTTVFGTTMTQLHGSVSADNN